MYLSRCRVLLFCLPILIVNQVTPYQIKDMFFAQMLHNTLEVAILANTLQSRHRSQYF